MNLVYAIILGIIQGLTEFLPVSSSGHLVFGEALLPAFKQRGILFEILLHTGTLIAVVLYFRNDLAKILYSFLGRPSIQPEEKRQFRRLGWLILLSMVPTAVIAFLLRSYVERSFTSPLIAGILLLVTGLLLFATKFFRREGRPINNLQVKDSLIIGLMQGLAVFPGISRSGATISAGIFIGVDKGTAARFSFLLSIPAIAGALIFDLKELVHLAQTDLLLLGYYIAGAVTAGLVGYLSIGWLLRIIKRFRLFLFSYYCWVIGLIAIILHLLLKG